MKAAPRLYDPNMEHSACGVGFLTRKDGTQTHALLELGHEALCAVPHRGGMSSMGVGDGAGLTLDLSLQFFSRIVGKSLIAGGFGVGNFFMPERAQSHEDAVALIEDVLARHKLSILAQRTVPTNAAAISERALAFQLPIEQWVFEAPEGIEGDALDSLIHRVLLEIEATAYTVPELRGLYPVSLSSRIQTLKGRLNSWELVPFFTDLDDADQCVHTLYFHTRFSTNTDPHPSMAQPFRLLAHNGELNTDKKNRLSETAIAQARNKSIIRPKGQSDSCRLDQTLSGRVYDEGLDLVEAVVAMMPPAWENETTMPADARAMFEYFSLYEEKNDGPAALIFGDGNVVGARLDRLGLRPLRTTETTEYLAVMSEAGQISFSEETVLRRGRVEAGGMIYFDRLQGKIFRTQEALEKLAAKKDYASLVQAAQHLIDAIAEPENDPATAATRYEGDLNTFARYVGYSHNQESFKFLLDPMLQTGVEKVSAMGYGNAINALSDQEGGMAKYFSQRFAQVTNPPLDSIREADGMTLRVALGEKPQFGEFRSKQIIVNSPVLRMTDVLKIKEQDQTPWQRFDILYTPVTGDAGANERAITAAIDDVAQQVSDFAAATGGIAILTDRHISSTRAPIPLILVVSAVNQRMIELGVRFKASLVAESGQIVSSHHIACVLGFGAAAVYPLTVRLRAEQLFGDTAGAAYGRFMKAAEKALMKTMGKVGLCTVESYSGGEFFEPNFLSTQDPTFAKYLPNMTSPVGGVGFDAVARSASNWHARAQQVAEESHIPILGLFKERSQGAGHSFGTAAVRGFVDLTEEPIAFDRNDESADPMRLLTLRQMDDAFGLNEDGYVNTSFDKLTPAQIDSFKITPGYRHFQNAMTEERTRRPAALRDVIALPPDVSFCQTAQAFTDEFAGLTAYGNTALFVRGLAVDRLATASNDPEFALTLPGGKGAKIGRLDALAQSLVERFGRDIRAHYVERGHLHLKLKPGSPALDFVEKLCAAPASIGVESVQPAHEITRRLASGAMSHGALVATAHEAVAHGTNMVGGMSNSGEGGEHITRYGTLRASRIKQFASGRFGVWAGYLADPNLEEIEIKIGQGAKPGEGGQLPAPKVTVEIAAARGGTPGVELISPPPHHDTYSIEDLGQLIHDAKAARVRVIVKLVSSEGIGTIAVGVAKAGADVINVAGNTGGTGAAAVTSLKYTGRAAEIGIAEVHQALCANGIRQKVRLRCSGAMQTGLDVVKASLLGGDSFEFGTTALMMLKCVMAKNCNVKCPAGLTTNAEVFDGDPRALAQYLLNIAHEVREILAILGLKSLDEARGRADLLHLVNHPSAVGQLNLEAMLQHVPEVRVDDPIYLERSYELDTQLLAGVTADLVEGGKGATTLPVDRPLTNRDKSVGGQLSIDMERMLNHTLSDLPAGAYRDGRGRGYWGADAITVKTHGSAGQSFGAFNNDGITLQHLGTCNDGVGKGACGGKISVLCPSERTLGAGENVLIGNFALFGATGGELFVAGEAGDRFAVRNSGASAVVEGVGEFACEYMTNGTVLNLGAFAKGFGNGMSGGFAYQYDPAASFQGSISTDSVLLGRVGDENPQSPIHEAAVKQLLEGHVAATSSPRAQAILADWESERANFAWIMPKALLQYQDADEILMAKSRKDLIDELATALCGHQISLMKQSWKQGVPVHQGRLPEMGEANSEAMYRLLNAYSVVEMAQSIVARRAGGKPANADRAVRDLILTEDFALMAALSKHARKALDGYGEQDLATMIADKRIKDFKRTLDLRNSLSMLSPGTYGWIQFQSDKNRAAMGNVPSFDSLFARHALPEVLARAS